MYIMNKVPEKSTKLLLQKVNYKFQAAPLDGSAEILVLIISAINFSKASLSNGQRQEIIAKDKVQSLWSLGMRDNQSWAFEICGSTV